jgi:hypothetical protein
VREVLVKAYVYFATMLAAAVSACAYGDSGVHPFHDGGTIIHADGGTKDAAKPPQDAAQKDSSVDPPDVEQTTCSQLPLGTGMPQCDTCLGASCCTEDQTCGNDQECMAFISCANNCFNQVDGGVDQQCETTCESQYPSGVNELSNLDSCMQNSCGTACGI